MDSQEPNKPNVFSFTGTRLDFYTPVQAQYNGNKPVMSMSQYGEINFYSSPFLNYNSILLKGSGDYKNGLSYTDNFGTTTGINGPVLFGERGGALGTRTGLGQGENVALSWDANNDVKIYGNLTVGGLLFSGLGKKIDLDAMSKFLQNYNQNMLTSTVISGVNISYNSQTSVGNDYQPVRSVSTPISATQTETINNMNEEIIGGISTGKIQTCNKPETSLINALTYDYNILTKVLTTTTSKITLTKNTVCTGLMKTKVLADIIGIGTTAPGAALDVVGSARIRGNLTVNGNLGIGTALPTAKLEVNGLGGGNIDISTNGRIRSNNNDGGLWVANDRFIGGHSTNKIGFYSNGDWRMTVQNDGNVGIGTITPTAKLDVVGDVKISGRLNVSNRVDATEFHACIAPGSCPDYVFEAKYKLMDLSTLNSYIEKNKHLPEVPSAKEMEGTGMDMKQMNLTLLKKVEEMTLYILEIEKRLQKVENK